MTDSQLNEPIRIRLTIEVVASRETVLAALDSLDSQAPVNLPIWTDGVSELTFEFFRGDELLGTIRQGHQPK